MPVLDFGSFDAIGDKNAPAIKRAAFVEFEFYTIAGVEECRNSTTKQHGMDVEADFIGSLGILNHDLETILNHRL